MVVSSRQLNASLLKGTVVFVHATDRLAKLGGKPVECLLALIVRVHDHVADLVAGLADDLADLPDVSNLLDLVLDQVLTDLHVACVPLRIQPKGSDEGHEHVREAIELARRRAEREEVICKPGIWPR